MALMRVTVVKGPLQVTRITNPAPLATNDGKSFKNYCEKTLGIPKENIKYIENATYGTMLGGIDWIKRFIKIKDGNAKVIVYYAGHGFPDDNTKQAYLLPTDGIGANTKIALQLDDIYKQ